ncbi:MAG: TetR/AcrR family transcriptional regulator [Planctomycetota bacterium]|jgi:AcrR family transcriptional regulator
MPVKGSRAAKAEQTRETLLRCARREFTERGYADASLGGIVRLARVTKGALYHHFDDKQALFRAVVVALEQELIGALRAAAGAEPDPWRRLAAMCRTYLDRCLQPDLQRLLILDAPVVLGWKDWCAIDKTHGIGAFTAELEAAMAAGLIDPQPSETLAQILLGALNTGARVIAAAADPAAARLAVGSSVDRLLAGLRTPRPA